MRTYPIALFAASLLASSASPVLASDGAFGNAIVPIRVSTESGPMQGTAVIVHREDQPGFVSLDLLTSATLFESPLGDCEIRPVSVQLSDGRWWFVSPNDIRVPHSPMVDIAILRIRAPSIDVAPEPIDFAPPAIGSVFIVAAIDPQSGVKTVAEHVRFESTLFVVGDRDLSSLAGCVGAPAISPQGVVGIVRACDAGRAPTISLLAIARPFIELSGDGPGTISHARERIRIAPAARRDTSANQRQLSTAWHLPHLGVQSIDHFLRQR